MLPDPFLQQLKKHPVTFIQVGASGGLPKHWQPYSQLLYKIGFEPDPRSFHSLTSSNTEKYFNIGLHHQAGTLTLYQTSKPTVSSTLKPNISFLKQFSIADYFEIVSQTTIKVDTLDNLYQHKSFPAPDFIQLDTQGSELFILQGARQLLTSHIFGIEVEVEFAHMYVNQPLFYDLDQYLKPFDFHLFDLRPQYYKRTIGLNLGNRQGQLLHADALYLRSIPSYTNIIDQATQSHTKQLLFLHAFLICVHYGYLDYAQDLINNLPKVFSNHQYIQLARFLRRQRTIEHTFPDFPGRGHLYHAFQFLSEVFRPPHPRGRLRRRLSNAKIDH